MIRREERKKEERERERGGGIEIAKNSKKDTTPSVRS
jgi:hypothetical protein